MQHRFERRSHNAGYKAGRAAAGVFAGGNGDGVALIAIKQRVGGAVCVDVDQTGRDGRARRNGDIPRSIGGKNGGNAAILDD
jgi:hypothetical protein